MSTATAAVQIGAEFRSMVADANVLWRVTSVKGRVVTAIGVDEPYEINGTLYPSECAGERREFLREHVAAAIARTDAWTSLVEQQQTEADAFWASVNVGDTLHYRVHRDAWVRGTVERDQDGEKAFRSAALVGSGWRPHDLFTVDLTGSVHHGYHATKVIDSEVWTPRHGDLWEAGRADGLDEDPRNLTEHALHPPAPTPDQQAEYAKGKQVSAIRKAVEDHTLSVDERLAQVRSILDGEDPVS